MAVIERSQGARLAYEQIAPFYDDFTAHHDYELWLGNLLPAAENLGLAGCRVLDVACGTGKSFLPLLERGWDVTACDISEAMLDRARAKAAGRATLEVADMRALPTYGQFDLVLCLDDAINYLLNREELGACLAGFRRNLAPGGLALFDTNTLLSYRSFFASTVAQDSDQGQMVWRGGANTNTEPGATIEATFEVVGTDHPASSAIHRQHHFPPTEILAGLEAAGLRSLATFGHGLDAVLEQPLDETRHTKTIFIAQPS